MESREKCTTLEEEIYWKNFHFVHFSLILPPDFLHHLKLPRKFVDYLGTKLPDEVVLKVNGTNWNVHLEKGTDDVAFRGDGWLEFVKAYSLKKEDILVFKYNRLECFEVLLFDNANSCEKEASYFVRKAPQSKCDGHQSNGGMKENVREDSKDKSQKRGSVSNSALRNNNSRPLKNHVSNGSIDGNQEGKGDSDAPRNRLRKRTADRSLKDYSSEDLTDESQEADESGHGPRDKHRRNSDGIRAQKTIPRENSARGPLYKSNRRPITEAEINKAFEMAKEKSAKYQDSFIVVMRPSCVYKTFSLTIPKEWEPRSVFKNGEEVTLRVKEKTWMCRFSSSLNNGGFHRGWRNFALDNGLEEYDVCLFVPIGRKDENFVLEVRIFRVVPEVVPPSLVMTTP